MISISDVRESKNPESRESRPRPRAQKTREISRLESRDRESRTSLISILARKSKQLQPKNDLVNKIITFRKHFLVFLNKFSLKPFIKELSNN